MAPPETFLDRHERHQLDGVVGQALGWIDRLGDARKRAEALTAVMERAERRRTRAILEQRSEGHSWAVVGASIGKNRETVRGKYAPMEKV